MLVSLGKCSTTYEDLLHKHACLRNWVSVEDLYISAAWRAVRSRQTVWVRKHVYWQLCSPLSPSFFLVLCKIFICGLNRWSTYKQYTDSHKTNSHKTYCISAVACINIDFLSHSSCSLKRVSNYTFFLPAFIGFNFHLDAHFWPILKCYCQNREVFKQKKKTFKIQ